MHKQFMLQFWQIRNLLSKQEIKMRSMKKKIEKLSAISPCGSFAHALADEQ